jgi:hypothetical protein
MVKSPEGGVEVFLVVLELGGLLVEGPVDPPPVECVGGGFVVESASVDPELRPNAA